MTGLTGFQAWAAMGGYAVFVWPAYATALVVLGGAGLFSWARYRASLRDLDRLQREPRER